MSLPVEVNKIKKRILEKSKRSDGEIALLSELEAIEKLLPQQRLDEVRSSITKMTRPDERTCNCCGQPI